MNVHIFDIMVLSQKSSKEKLEKAAYILKTVAHPTRLAIIEALGVTEKLGVGSLSEMLGCEQSLLSHHLINMKLRGILISEKEGQNVFYSLKEKDVLKLISCIENCDCIM
jgi:DNA-binding transcriptional ArsR family regulator